VVFYLGAVNATLVTAYTIDAGAGNPFRVNAKQRTTESQILIRDAMVLLLHVGNWSQRVLGTLFAYSITAQHSFSSGGIPSLPVRAKAPENQG